MKTQIICGLCSLLLASTALAGGDASDGHSHGPEETRAPVQETNTPRLVMVSSQFEMLGLVVDSGLQLYLDDYTSNAPVTDASIELEVGGQRVGAQAQADGTFLAPLAQALPEGKYAVLATILAGDTSDLLIGELSIQPEAEDTHAMSHGGAVTHGGGALSWLGGLLLLALAMLTFTLKRDRQQRRAAP